MESRSSVFKNIILTCEIALLVFQLSMLAFFSDNKFGPELFFISLTFTGTVIFFCLVN